MSASFSTQYDSSPLRVVTDKKGKEHPVVIGHLLPDENWQDLLDLGNRCADALTLKLWPAWPGYVHQQLDMSSVGNTRYVAFILDQTDDLKKASPLGYVTMDYDSDTGLIILETLQTHPSLRGSKIGRLVSDVLEKEVVKDLEAKGKPVHGVFVYTDHPAGQSAGNNYDIDPTARAVMYATSGFSLVPWHWTTPAESCEDILLRGDTKGLACFRAISFLKSFDGHGKESLEGARSYIEACNEDYVGMAFLGLISKKASSLASSGDQTGTLLAETLRSLYGETLKEGNHTPKSVFDDILRSTPLEKRKEIEAILKDLLPDLEKHSLVKIMRQEGKLRSEIAHFLISYQKEKMSKGRTAKGIQKVLMQFAFFFGVNFNALKGKAVRCISDLPLDSLIPRERFPAFQHKKNQAKQAIGGLQKAPLLRLLNKMPI